MDANTRGILLMITAMVFFSIADALVKIATDTLSSAQALFYLVLGGAIIFPLIALFQRDSLVDTRAFSPILLLRYAAEITGMVGMVKALSLVPISTVGAITQATPLLVAATGVLILHERIGWRRWCAIVAGFIGVLLIVQPSTDTFEVSILWSVLALAGLGVRDLTTRLAPADMPTSSLGAYTLFAALPFAIAWVLFRGEDFIHVDTNWIVIAPMMVLGSIGYLSLIASLRKADVSVVMPFRFSRAVFLLIIGVMVFDEKPNAMMIIGAMMIIASGAYLMRREHRRAVG